MIAAQTTEVITIAPSATTELIVEPSRSVPPWYHLGNTVMDNERVERMRNILHAMRDEITDLFYDEDMQIRNYMGTKKFEEFQNLEVAEINSPAYDLEWLLNDWQTKGPNEQKMMKKLEKLEKKVKTLVEIENKFSDAEKMVESFCRNIEELKQILMQ